jgi:ribosomal-protein-alanine N-acetyltransferase
MPLTCLGENERIVFQREVPTRWVDSLITNVLLQKGWLLLTIFQTKRLTVRAFTTADATFLLEVMNQPAYHRYIGDRGLRTTAEAIAYIDEKFIPAYHEHGFGFWLVCNKQSVEPVGFAGIVNRPELEYPDLGYALHQNYTGKGFAEEAAKGVLDYNRTALHLNTLLAITDQENHASINVLMKCGFHFLKEERVFDDVETLNVYQWKIED